MTAPSAARNLTRRRYTAAAYAVVIGFSAGLVLGFMIGEVMG